MATLWKGLCTGFSPDPRRIDDLIGKRLRKSGLKGTRTRGKCTFASTSRDQAENYADSPADLVNVLPSPGSFVAWSPDAGDLVLSFQNFLGRERWRDASWASPAARDIIMDVMGCVITFEHYLMDRIEPEVTTEIVDYWLQEISVRECIYVSPEQLTRHLDGHMGEVWVTGGCKLVPLSPSTAQDDTTTIAA